MCRGGWFGLPLFHRYAREGPAWRRGFFTSAQGCAHAVQFENGVNRVACRRGNAELAAELADLSGEPIKLQAVAAFKIVRHRSPHTRLDLVHEEIHSLVDVSMIE